MEDSLRKRRRVIAIGLSPERSRVLVLRNRESMWHLPDSNLHWRVGQRKKTPQNMASYMLRDATISLLGETTHIQKHIIKESKRYKLPTGGFAFVVPSNPTFNVSSAAESSNRVRKHLKLEGRCEMHKISDISLSDSHFKYGSGTIEAIRSVTC